MLKSCQIRMWLWLVSLDAGGQGIEALSQSRLDRVIHRLTLVLGVDQGAVAVGRANAVGADGLELGQVVVKVLGVQGGVWFVGHAHVAHDGGDDVRSQVFKVVVQLGAAEVDVTVLLRDMVVTQHAFTNACNGKWGLTFSSAVASAEPLLVMESDFCFFFFGPSL